MTIEETLEILKDLTIKKDYITIRNILEAPRETPKQKGDLLELYMKELYEGNGWICNHKGGRDDKGADLLLSKPQTPLKVEHIVQTKNYNKPLGFKETRSELLQFEELGHKEYDCLDYKLISINGYSGSVEEKNMLNKLQLFNISLLDFSYIIELINNYNPNKTNLTPTMVLYSHNESSYTSILETWKHSNKSAIIMATGTGKSKVTIKLFKEKFKNDKKLLIAPTRYILKQFKNDPDAFGVENITYLTYSKLHNLKENELKELNPSLVVFDEFHRAGSKKWLKSVQNLLDANKDAKILGLSATPIRTDKKDMSAILFDNNISNTLTVQEAIVTGKLPTPIYVSGIYDLESEKNKLKERVLNSIHSDSEKAEIMKSIDKASIDWEHTQGASEILKKYLKFKNGKGIVFCEDTKHLYKMEEVVRKWFKDAEFMIKTNTVISKDPEHNKEFEEFKNSSPKNKIHILFCINKLSEGIHLDLDFAIFLRKTTSEIIYMQQMGRVLQAGKKGTPIVFDLVCNFKNIKRNNFLEDLIVTSNETNQLRETLGLPTNTCPQEYIKAHIHDETQDIHTIFKDIKNNLITTWDIQYKKAKTFFEENGHCNIPYNYNEDKSLAFWVANQRSSYRQKIISTEKYNLLDSINFTWNAIDEAWMEKYIQLKNHLEQYNYDNIHQYKKGRNSLSNWISYQRILFRRNKLHSDKIRLLNEIGFIWDIKDEEWFKYYNLFQRVSRKDESVESNLVRKCSSWATRQRKLYKEDKLPQYKVDLLNNIEFMWNPLKDEWFVKYNRLKQFYKKNKHSNVPSTSDDKVLAQWVSDNRKLYKNNKLSKKRIELLNELEFEWDLKNTLWINNYNRLQEYFYKFNNSNVPRQYKDDRPLGQWVNEQRKAFRAGKLSCDRVALLNELKFSWDPKLEEWQGKYEQVKIFYIANGHLNIPSNYKPCKTLSAWLQNQRNSYEKGTLCEDKIEKLKEININWN